MASFPRPRPLHARNRTGRSHHILAEVPSIVPVTAYERFGLPSYWVIDPDLDRPALRAFELTEGAYTEVAHITGDQAFHAQRPFDVQVIPGRLVEKLRRAGAGDESG